MDKRFQLGEDMFKEGKSLNRISKELKMTKSRLSRYLKDQGYEIKPAFQLSHEEKAKRQSKLKRAKEEYVTKNITVKKIAKKFNLEYYSFRDYLIESNIEIEEYINRKYFFDENIFQVIDTEEKSYWLGFLYADGAIIGNEAACEVSQADANLDHLEKFRKFVGADYKFKKKDRQASSLGLYSS